MSLPIINGEGEQTQLDTFESGGIHTPKNRIVALPGSVEADIGSSKTFLQTLAEAVSGSRVAVDLSATINGYLQALNASIIASRLQTDVLSLPGTLGADIATLAGAIASGSMKAALQAGTETIGKLAANAGVNIGTVELKAPSSATVAAVPSSATVVTICASNTGRVGLLVVNDSAEALCLKLGSGATLTDWSVRIKAGGYWEMPLRMYTGIVTGIWENEDGDARVTEAA